MAFQVINDATRLDHGAWQIFIQQHPNGNIFQSPDMFGLYQHTRNYHPIMIAVVDEQRQPVGLVLAVLQKEHPGVLGFFSARTIIWGGPLVDESLGDQRHLVMDLLLQQLLAQVKNRSIYVQFRNLFDPGDYQTVFEKHRFVYLEHLNYIVATNGTEDPRQRMSQSKVRQIKKSLKAGARIVEAENLAQVEKFYEILKNLYKTKVKKPLPDWSFFKTFFELSRRKNLGKYLLIEYQDQIVGGIMCPITPGGYIYEWYVCGIDRIDKDVYPGILATYAPIHYAAGNGIRGFDFMGAGKPDQDYGVREFKSKFGGRLVSYGRFERINYPRLYQFGKLGLKIITKIRF